MSSEKTIPTTFEELRWFVRLYPKELSTMTGPLWEVVDRTTDTHDAGDLYAKKRVADRQAHIYNTEGKMRFETG